MNEKPKLATFLLSLIYYSFQVQATDDKFIKRYAVMKMYESCFSPDVVKEIRKEMKMAASKCSSASSPAYQSNVSTKSPMTSQQQKPQPADGGTYSPEHLKSQTSPSIDLNKLQQIIVAGFHKQPPSQPSSFYSNNVSPSMPHSPLKPWMFFPPSSAMSYSHLMGFSPGTLPSTFGTPYFSPINAFHQSAFFSPFYGAGRSSKDLDFKGQFESVAAKVSGRFKNITCIMQELGYLDDNLEPNYEGIMKRIKILAIPNDLKSDMVDAVQYCKQFSMCVPDESKDKLFKEMVRPMFFFRCYKHKKMEACIMRDIKDRYSHNDAEDNILGYKRNDRSSHEVSSSEVAELTSYDFLFGDDFADFETF